MEFLGWIHGFLAEVEVVHGKGQGLFSERCFRRFGRAVSVGAEWCMGLVLRWVGLGDSSASIEEKVGVRLGEFLKGGNGIGLSSWDVDGFICWGEGG